MTNGTSLVPENSQAFDPEVVFLWYLESLKRAILLCHYPCAHPWFGEIFSNLQ